MIGNLGETRFGDDYPFLIMAVVRVVISLQDTQVVT